MRLSTATPGLLLLLLASVPCHCLLQLGATKGLVALGTSLATLVMLGSGIVSTSLRVPLATVGPLRLPIPVLLGLKGIGFVKLRALLNKLSPTTTIRLGKGTPFTEVRNVDSANVPGIVVVQPREEADLIRPVLPDAPSYQRQLKRVTETLPMSALGEIFSHIEELDPDGCLLRVTCELAVDPTLADDIGTHVTTLLTSFGTSDSTAPWIKFQNAAISGQLARSRKACHRKFNQCSKSTTAIVAEARKRFIKSITL